jgi:FKBP-type peptidyl-prolyl cis-trans isomerase FkpA
MKSYLSIFLVLFLFVSCSEDEETFEFQTETDIIKYISDNNVNAEKTNSGLYYVLNEEGSGARPAENSIVNIEYKAYFLDGTIIGESEAELFDLSQVIQGLKEGIQLFKEGGNGTLIIPSNLAFGASGNGAIRGGAVLIFDIKLIEIIDYEAQNEIDILKYIDDNSLEATKTDSGLYYVINEEGTGARPTANSNVTVDYKGYFLDGTVFDESNSDGLSIGLNQVIAGWTEGIQLFKEGGDGVLLIPSNLGYGIRGSGAVPGGAVLIFDVKLIRVN